MIKEKALTLSDLDRIWEAQAGKHEAIVKNVHDLLAKLAWDFSPEQLDHLFECFQVGAPFSFLVVFYKSVSKSIYDVCKHDNISCFTRSKAISKTIDASF